MRLIVLIKSLITIGIELDIKNAPVHPPHPLPSPIKSPISPNRAVQLLIYEAFLTYKSITEWKHY